MRNKLILLTIFCVYVNTLLAQELEKKLNELSKEYGFTYESVQVNTPFSEKYILWVEQPVDHPAEPLCQGAGLGVAHVFALFKGQQRHADLVDSLEQGKVGL